MTDELEVELFYSVAYTQADKLIWGYVSTILECISCNKSHELQELKKIEFLSQK